MNYIFIPDIHCKVDDLLLIYDYFCREKEKNQNTKLICFGDLLDSFDLSPFSGIRCLELVLEWVKNWNCILLQANHEMSYAHHSQKCSGYKVQIQLDFSRLRPEYLKLSVPYYIIDGDNLPPNSSPILCTHAGLSGKFLEYCDISPINVESALEFLRKWKQIPLEQSPSHPFFVAGHYSGGVGIGGIFWCRPQEFSMIPGLTQIFGHTAIRQIMEIKPNNFLIDCLDNKKEILTLINGKFIIEKF